MADRPRHLFHHRPAADPDALENVLHALAAAELASGDVVPALMEQAFDRAHADPEAVAALYVQWRIEQLRAEAERAAGGVRDYLAEEDERARRALSAPPGGWKLFRGNGAGVLKLGGLALALYVFVFLLVLVFA